ncbi:MAG TPA: hypothetical protein VIH86_08575 [Puia sp.]
MLKKYFLIFVLIVIQYCAIGQSRQKGISFYCPDSVSNKNYSGNQQRLNYKVQYENLKNANVELDVTIALHNKDLRIISISGVDFLYPGLESSHKPKSRHGLDKRYEDHLEKYGFKVIEGTSDVINQEAPDLQSVAYNYASKYNTLLFKKLVTK